MPLVHIWNGNVIGKEVILSNSSICNFQCFYHIRYDEIRRVVAFLGTFETRIIFEGGGGKRQTEKNKYGCSKHFKLSVYGCDIKHASQ